MVTGKNCIIESIRTPGEVESLREKGNFLLFAVDADPLLRYDRIVMRNSETDKISYKTFVENEEREMQSDDPNKQNIGKCIVQADQIFYNNSTVHDLHKLVESELINLNI
jgi:dephospho-CoA kinase